MTRRPRTARPAGKSKNSGEATASSEVERLSRELAEARARLGQIEDHGVDAFTARKIEALIEAAQIARGQALDAALERTKAQGELRALRDAIEKASGPAGWLLRRAARRLAGK